MSWLKVDDGFPSHEKVMALCEGPCRSDALALWLFAGCWSSHALRDGFVPNGVVRAFGFHPEAASELVRVKLWCAAEGGYRYHDWADYQPSAAQIEERRRAGAVRKARSRAKLSAPGVGVSQRPSRVESQRDGGSVTAVPRTESRLCLADASRDRDRALTGSSVSSSLSASEAALAFRKPLPEPPPGLPPVERPLAETIVVEHAREYGVRRGGERPPEDRTSAVKLAAWCEANAAHRATSARELALRVVGGLFASERAATSRWRLTWAAKDPAEFLPPPPGSQPLPTAGGYRGRGPAPVSDRDEIARLAAEQNPDWIRHLTPKEPQ